MGMLFFGCMILVGVCGGAGLWLAARIRRRPRELREAIVALTLLDTEIVWGSTPLPEAFAVLKERMNGVWRSFFAELEERLKGGENARNAWSQTILHLSDSFCLKTDDWKIIEDVGKGLGRSNRQEQHKQLELIRQQLTMNKEQVTAGAEKQAKMWSYLGFVAGIACVIILL